jgi:hypothetical protein
VLPQAALPGIIGVLAGSMDALAISLQYDDFGRARSWPAAEHLTNLLFRALELADRPGCIAALFEQEQSLGWITSILRSEIFAHGHYGDRREPADQWLLTEAEFNQVLATMLCRYRASAPETLLAVPNLVGLLYGWQQGAGNDEAREWVQAQTQTVRGLLKFLSSARGWRQINDRTYYPLQRRELGNFLDYDAALQRLRLVLPLRRWPPRTVKRLWHS